MVILALVYINFAAGVEAKHFIVQIFALHEQAEAAVNAKAGLGVYLEMRVKINVAGWSLEPQIFRIAGGHVLVLVNHRSVVGHSKVDRDSSTVIAGTDVERVGSLTLQRRRINSPGNAVSLGVRVRVVCRHAESSERVRQEIERLQIGKLHAADMGIRPVNDSAGRTCG